MHAFCLTCSKTIATPYTYILFGMSNTHSQVIRVKARLTFAAWYGACPGAARTLWSRVPIRVQNELIKLVPSIKINTSALTATSTAAPSISLPSCAPDDSTTGLSCETSATLSKSDIDALDLETEFTTDTFAMITGVDADMGTTGGAALSPLPAFQIGAFTASEMTATEFETTMSPLPAVHLGVPSPKDEINVTVTAPPAFASRTPQKHTASSPVTSEVRGGDFA
jgi:hypothetical protein